jgi:hypothetical protein
MSLVAAGAAAVALAGCSSTPHGDAVRQAARTFVADLAHGNGAAACRMLTDSARSSASGATSASCSEAVTGVKDTNTRITGVQVWGDAAQVHIGRDVLFLRMVSGRWQVNAAGCTPQGDRPYDCKIGG